jgi:hypothetical protein
MPMFYFQPFKFKSDAERKQEVPVVDFGPRRDTILYVLSGLLLLALFAAFIIAPAVIALQQAAPAG